MLIGRSGFLKNVKKCNAALRSPHTLTRMLELLGKAAEPPPPPSKMLTFLAFPRKFEGRYQVGIQELRSDSVGQLRYITIAMETFDTPEQANEFSARFTGEPCF